MNRRWGWTLAFIVTSMVAVAVFWTPLGALLGGLVLLAWAAALLLAHGKTVYERNALVVLRRPGDIAVRVEARPGWVPLAPWEKAGPTLDTADKLQTVTVEEMVQADLTPIALGFEVNLVRRLVPGRIPEGTLGQALPALNELTLSRIVQNYTDDLLRCLFESEVAGAYGPAQHKRIERHLRSMLEDRLRPLGVVVSELWMIARPVAGLYEALAAAAQQRVAIDVEGMRLGTLLTALAGTGDPARSLALLELARAMAGDPKWVSLDLQAWLRQAGGQEPPQPGTAFEPGAPAGAQTPGWSSRLPVQ